MINKNVDELLCWIRQYAENRINSRLFDERRCFPPHVILDLGNEGLLGMCIPNSYGGLGLTNAESMKIYQQLAAIDTALGLFVGLNNILGLRPIYKYGKEELKDELLFTLAQGRQLAAFALSEPVAGSNPLAIETYAKYVSNGEWKIYGQKSWSGSAAWASTINIFARQYDKNDKFVGITAFNIKQGFEGLRQGPEALTMGMRGMIQNTVFLEGVSVNDSNCLGEVGGGLDIAQDAMMHGRLALGAMSLGGMKRCMQLMLRYASQRNISTGNLLENSVSLHKLSEHTAVITSLEILIDLTAEFLDMDDDVPVEFMTVCKIIGSEYFWHISDNLVQMLGGRGYIENNIAPQILRDARVFRIFEGPTETLFSFLGSRSSNEKSILFDFIRHRLSLDKHTEVEYENWINDCLLYTSPSPRDRG